MSLRRGMLSDYFKGIVSKRLSSVEADTSRSNQHEFNGVAALRTLFGAEQPRKFPARFLWMSDEQEALAEDGFVTWYDARENHPHRSEYRLYFPTTSVSEIAQEGDVMFIAQRTNDSVLVVIVPAASTVQSQLSWLFGLDNQPGLTFEGQEIGKDVDAELDFAANYILDELGIEPEEPQVDAIDAIVERLGNQFPRTREFSELARSTLPDVSPVDAPDEALIAWMEREELLFRRVERQIVAARLKGGFLANDEADVDGFLAFSLSVQNRRKSRAGMALENHLEAVFSSHKVRYARGAETENKNKPDFLFPGKEEYQDASYPAGRLTMLGSKSSLKDRWRQVLSEAERIPNKHLLTLEPSISRNQTDEMMAKHLQLVVPKPLHSTYAQDQQGWLLSLFEFLTLVKARQ